MKKDLNTDVQTGSDDPTSGATTSQVDGGQTGSKSQDSGAQKDQGSADDQLDVDKLDPKVKKLISDLRKENGDHRKKNKALSESHGKLKQSLIEAGIIEDDSEDPKEKLEKVNQNLHGATLRNAVLEAALDHGVGKENLKYFEFLISDRLSQLGEDEELSEDDLATIALEATRGKSSASGTTSVGDGKGGKPNPQGSGEVTLDQFTHMNMTDKTLLFKKNPDLYNRLFAEAKSKKLLVK